MGATQILYKTLELDMMPAHMALYAFFITHKQNCKENHTTCKNCRKCFVEFAQMNNNDIAEIYKKICGTRPVDEMSDSGITSLSAENFRSLKSRINKKIAQAFGHLAAKKLEITATGTRPDTKYGILMDKKHIQMVI